MASAILRRFRPIVAIAALGATALIVPSASATPDAPGDTGGTSTIAQVQRQLGQLVETNSQLVEQYDQVQNLVQAKTAAAAVAKRAAAKADGEFEVARSRFGAAAAAQYEGGSFSATGALLTSDSGQGYLDTLTTLSMISSHTAQVVSNLTEVQKTADAAQKHAKELLTAATTQRDALVKKKAEVQKQLDKYQTLLDTMTATQRAAYQARTNPTVSATTVTAVTAKVAKAGTGAVSSKGAAQAVRFALAQVGKPYVFGAAGPGSYDCSGLTMRAWGSAGVSLPHSAADQYNYGTHISFSELAPGDLMFYYSPIGHVTIYIGDGYMVTAPQSGEDVKVAPAVDGNGYVGATRL